MALGINRLQHRKKFQSGIFRRFLGNPCRFRESLGPDPLQEISGACFGHVLRQSAREDRQLWLGNLRDSHSLEETR